MTTGTSTEASETRYQDKSEEQNSATTVIKLKRTKSTSVESLVVDDERITEPMRISEKFVYFFKRVIEKLRHTLPTTERPNTPSRACNPSPDVKCTSNPSTNLSFIDSLVKRREVTASIARGGKGGRGRNINRTVYSFVDNN